MIEHTLFLTWISQTLSNCNLAQAGFVVRLLEDYLHGMESCRALLRPAINACLGKLQEVRAVSGSLPSSDGDLDRIFSSERSARAPRRKD